MAAKKYILGVFDDDLVLLNAVGKIREAGVKIHDVFTPFPIHGIDDVLGIKPTRLHTAGFIFGAVGVTLMFLYITWINTVNYPLIFGGKPYFALPAYIPILFEITVLSAAVGMVVAYFVRNRMSPIRQTPVMDERTTDDKFVISFEADNLSLEEKEQIRTVLNEQGAIEINEKEFE
jgi:Alternative complex III, ActD subunit